ICRKSTSRNDFRHWVVSAKCVVARWMCILAASHQKSQQDVKKCDDIEIPDGSQEDDDMETSSVNQTQ
ncbi:hypothetical protein LSAT2_019592, partial [Lamellibrachia satsuma]